MLSKAQRKHLNLLFLEAKCLYNFTIADIRNRLTKPLAKERNTTWKRKKVEIKIADAFEMPIALPTRRLATSQTWSLCGYVRENGKRSFFSERVHVCRGCDMVIGQGLERCKKHYQVWVSEPKSVSIWGGRGKACGGGKGCGVGDNKTGDKSKSSHPLDFLLRRKQVAWLRRQLRKS